MDVEKLPRLTAPNFGDVNDRRLPMLSFAWRFDGAHRAAAHRHRRAHIIQPEQGTYWVVAPEGTWLVPAGQAMWIPPWIEHQVYSHRSVAARMVFIDEAFAAGLPQRCGAVRVTPLLRELIARAVSFGNHYPPRGPASRLAAVLLDELAGIELSPLLIPVSQDPRLARVMKRVIERPGETDELEEICKQAGASPRTLARLFRAETGMTFTQWRTRLRLLESIERLAEGATVTEVALDLGYASTSSFVFAFRTHLGTPPARYARRRDLWAAPIETRPPGKTQSPRQPRAARRSAARSSA